MSVQMRAPGETVTFVLSIVDEGTPGNNPVVGETATVALRRLSDDKWWDWVAGAWDVVANYAALGAEHKQALTDKGDGTYEVDWDQSANDAGAERQYVASYEVTTAPASDYTDRMDHEHWHFGSEYTFTALASPAAPGSSALCRCYAYMQYIEGGGVVGAGDGTLGITEVVDRPAGSSIVYAPGTVPAETDATGLVYIDVVRGAIVVFKAIFPRGVQSIQTVRVLNQPLQDIGEVLQP
jgi:hypothetical protein